jgi:hypothetical protein
MRRMEVARERYFASSGLFTRAVLRTRLKGGIMDDFLYVLLTVVVFGFLWLLVKGVERFER